MTALRIGIDFDNTLARYDEVFLKAAKKFDLVPKNFQGNKQAVRDAIRLTPEGEIAWQKLQGHVYGIGIVSASLFDGVDAFLNHSRAAGSEIFIVSHKTEYGHYDPDHINLRKSALDWMTASGFFCAEGYGIPVTNVHFESTREDKLARIAALNCTHFIDDLEEVLSDPGFPAGVKRILFAQQHPASAPDAVHCRTWHEISKAVLGERN